MAVTEEDVRKALEDMLYANLIEIYNIKYGEVMCTAGVDVSVSFVDPPYENGDDYIIGIIEALDVDYIDIKWSIQMKDFTATGFTLTSPRNTIVKWTSTRKVPKINFHTT